jgi:hypothetical protein
LSTYCQPFFNFIVNIIFTKKPKVIAFATFYPKGTKIRGDHTMPKAVSVVLFDRDWQGNDFRSLRFTGQNLFTESKGALRPWL